MAKTEKCAHDICVCMVPEDGDFGKYCSDHCKDMSKISTLRCECGHEACIADATRRPGRQDDRVEP